MKTAIIHLSNIKDSNGWFDICHDLFGEKNDNDLEGDEEPYSNKKCYEWFEYGEYANMEIIVDENFNIVGGKIIKSGK